MSSLLAVNAVISMLPGKEVVYRGSVVASMRGIADQYLLGKDVSRGYAANIRRTAAKVTAAGIKPDSISGDAVSMWLSSLRAKGLSSVTVHSERRNLLTLWKFGVDAGLILTPIRGVLKPKVTRRVTRAFTRDQCTRAVKRFNECDLGLFQSGCPKNLWMEAWVRYVYETGARFTDAHALKAEYLVPGGVAWVASKTGQPVIKRLSDKTSGLLTTLAAQSPDGTVFRWAVSRRHAFAAIREAFKEAGLEGGRTQWLRRSGATHAEMAAPGTGAAKAYLSHATHGLAEKHYIDQSQLLPQMPGPLPLD
jgi:site-specific recombinase XerC